MARGKRIRLVVNSAIASVTSKVSQALKALSAQTEALVEEQGEDFLLGKPSVM
jgi:hypothetical protein